MKKWTTKCSRYRKAACFFSRTCASIRGEELNDATFARRLATSAELYVNDAFGTAHRAHASTVGMVKHFPKATAGLLMGKRAPLS